MARLPRLTLADLPHLIIQRGNNGTEIFVDAQDRETMLALLREMALSHQLAVHAYALLPSQLLLLATPRSDDGLPRFMQAVGRRYVRYFNDRHARSGTLWEGRYRGTVLQARWMLPAMVFIDGAPVREGLVEAAADWPGSSYSHNAGLRNDALIHPHAMFWTLGNTPFARDAAYAEAVAQGLGAEDLERIRDAALRGWALGDGQFIADLQQRTDRRVTRQRAGRPPGRTGDSPATAR